MSLNTLLKTASICPAEFVTRVALMVLVTKSNIKNITTTIVRENKVFIEAYGITLSYTVKTYIGTEIVRKCDRIVARSTYTTPDRTGPLIFFAIFIFFSKIHPMQVLKHDQLVVLFKNFLYFLKIFLNCLDFIYILICLEQIQRFRDR